VKGSRWTGSPARGVTQAPHLRPNEISTLGLTKWRQRSVY